MTGRQIDPTRRGKITSINRQVVTSTKRQRTGCTLNVRVDHDVTGCTCRRQIDGPAASSRHGTQDRHCPGVRDGDISACFTDGHDIQQARIRQANISCG